MQFLWFLIIGGVAGWLAGLFMKGGFGIPVNIVAGIIGAMIGGFVFAMFGLVAIGLIGTMFTALAGAIIFLFIVSLFRRRTRI
jgi:uncharacterized membrane protein YeaQ/YmgE (transglycosylase-associated protein family)